MRLFLLVCCLVSPALALDLSDVNLKTLHDKTIAYFPGSFDPFHKAHFEIIEKSLEKADYVLVIPSGIPDRRKPHRTAPELRRDMLEDLYKNHPRVLTSQLTPGELQKILKPHFPFITFKGVTGSDILDEFAGASPKALKAFMSGQDIPPTKFNTAYGATMVVPTQILIVPLREENSPWAQRKNFHRFQVDPLPLSQEVRDISSSGVKEQLKRGDMIQHLIPSEVANFIEANQMYQKEHS